MGQVLEPVEAVCDCNKEKNSQKFEEVTATVAVHDESISQLPAESLSVEPFPEEDQLQKPLVVDASKSDQVPVRTLLGQLVKNCCKIDIEEYFGAQSALQNVYQPPEGKQAQSTYQQGTTAQTQSADQGPSDQSPSAHFTTYQYGDPDDPEFAPSLTTLAEGQQADQTFATSAQGGYTDQTLATPAQGGYADQTLTTPAQGKDQSDRNSDTDTVTQTQSGEPSAPAPKRSSKWGLPSWEDDHFTAPPPR
mmetsp:Transcript_79346/g.140040  ORF Transcript_79346/g.140040 Transcript_79346/m.140040 type:complete len:249 (+) Transcript_79346:53-799(+)